MLLYGKPLAKIWQNQLAKQIKKLNRPPRLGIIQFGQKAASNIYIANKIKIAKNIGIQCIYIQKRKSTNAQALQLIKKIARGVDGLIVQLPMPKNLDKRKILDAIPIAKDIDGLSSGSLYRQVKNEQVFWPATVNGIIRLLKYLKVKPAKNYFVIVGAGQLVGKPLGWALLNQGASITWIEKGLKDIASLTKNANVLVAAAGSPNLIGKNNVKAGQIVIDAGFTIKKGKVFGDVQANKIKSVVKYVTPVPGGVGPLTIVGLLDNLVRAKRT